MLAFAIALASLAADVSWTDHSGQCPASRGRALVEEAAQGSGDTSIDVQVEATDAGLSATLRLETPHGSESRTLRSPACDTLVEAAVLITRAAGMAAVIPDPPEPEPEPVPDPEIDPAPESVPDPEPNPGNTSSPSRPRQSAPAPPASDRTPTAPPARLFGSLRAFGFGTFETTPGFGGGGGAAVGLGSKFWRADLSGLVSAPTSTEDDPAIRAWAWALGLDGCGTLDVLNGRLQPGFCGGLEAGEQLGRGTGALVNGRPQRGPWLAATVGPTLRGFVAPGVALVVDLDAVVSVLRPGFRVRDGSSHQPNVVAPRVALGVELQLPR